MIVGQEERAYYAPEGLAKFPELEREGYLRQVYQGGAVTIYEIVAKDRGRVESYAYFLKPLFGEPSDLESMTFVSPGPANSPARQ